MFVLYVVDDEIPLYEDYFLDVYCGIDDGTAMVVTQTFQLWKQYTGWMR